MGEKLEGSWKRVLAVICAVFCALCLSLGAVKSGYAADTLGGTSAVQPMAGGTSSDSSSKTHQGATSQQGRGDATNTNNGSLSGSSVQLSTNADGDGDITKECVITFYENVGEGDIQKYNVQPVKANTTVKLYKNQYHREGYFFDGWALTKDGDKKYDDEATLENGIENDLSLYVHWKKAVEYVVSYDANGGTGVVESQTLYVEKKGDEAPLELRNNSFERIGHKFVEWNTKRDGSGNGYNQGASVTTSSSTVMYAQWEELKAKDYGEGYAPDRYTLTLNAHGGTPTSYAWSVSDGTSVKLTCPFTYEGYMFDGWLDEPNDTEPLYREGAVVPITGDMTLYAKWTPSSSDKHVSFIGEGTR